MNEQYLFIRFLKENWIIILTISALLSLAGLYYQIRKPTRHILEKVYTIEIAKNLNICSLNEYQALADEEVSIIRIGNIQQAIGVSKGVLVTTARISPKVFKIGVSSGDRSTLGPDISKIENYLLDSLSNKNYSFQSVGVENYNTQKPNIYIGLIIGLSVGLFLSLVTASIKEYSSLDCSA